MVSPGMRVIKNKNKPNAIRIGLQANSLFLFFFFRDIAENSFYLLLCLFLRNLFLRL